MLSRKHYTAIADILQDEIDETAMMNFKVVPQGFAGNRVAAICDVTKEMARYFQRDNPRFNMPKFIKRAGCLDVIKIGDIRGPPGDELRHSMIGEPEDRE